MYDEVRLRALADKARSLVVCRLFGNLSRKCYPGTRPNGHTSSLESRCAAPTSGDWWRGFRSRELTDLIEEGQVANPRHRSRRWVYRAGPRRPRPWTRRCCRRSISTELQSGKGGPELNNIRAGLNASYELDFCGRNPAASRAAQGTAVASRYPKNVVILSTIVSVGTAYFQLSSPSKVMR
jgi:outer membrane protein, multidrug efflux system